MKTIDSSLIASSSVVINASPERIWEVMTLPENIKVYLYGTQVSTDWQAGSPIEFKGEYNGQTYLDKGNVLKNEMPHLLQYNYWSGFSGMEDTPNNYAVVTYKIEAIPNGHCQFTWHQQGFSSEEGKCHTEEGLKTMLVQIKELAEG